MARFSRSLFATPAKRAAVVVVVCAVLVLLPFAYYYETTSDLRRALPWSATEVQDHYVDLFPDYVYYLKAKMDVQDFQKYVNRAGLKPFVSANQHPIDWGNHIEHVGAWWDSSLDEDDTYIDVVGHETTIAKYEDGYLYPESVTVS